MKLNPREKVLILFFPGVLVFAAYVAIFGASSMRDLTRRQEQLRSARVSAVSMDEIYRQQKQLGQLNEQVEDARQRRDALLAQADELCGSITARRADFDSLEALTALFRRHGLLLVEESTASDSETGGMASSLEEATDKLKQSLDRPDSEVETVGQRVERRTRNRARTSVARRRELETAETRYRRLKFYGSFVKVAEAIEELAQSNDQPIPVSIAMEEIGWESVYGNPPLWTLVVRI